MPGVAAILEKYSHIRLATDQDNEKILKFLNAQSMKAGRFSLDFRRDPNFFKFVRQNSDEHFVFLFINDDQSLGGMGSILRKQRIINHTPAPVGYVCDLRIAPEADRKPKVQWRRCFSEIVEYMTQKPGPEHCENLFTAVLAENKAALRSLTERLKGIRYQPVADYEVYSLIAPIPNPFTTSTFTIDTNEDDHLRDFIRAEARAHTWTPLPAGDEQTEWEYRSKNWQSWQEFPPLIARGPGGEVLGCVKPWKDGSRKIVAKGLPRSLRLLGQALPYFGKPAVHEGSIVEVLNLSFFWIRRSITKARRQEVALGLLRELYRRGYTRSTHIVNWVPAPGDSALEDLARGRYIYVKTPGRVFQVTPESSDATDKTTQPERPYYFDGTL